MRPAFLIASMLLAVMGQTLLGRYTGMSRYIDLFLIVTVYASLYTSRVLSVLTGASCGLFQDLLNGTMLGVHSISKALIGYGLGAFSLKFMLTSRWGEAMCLVGASIFDATILRLLGRLLDLGSQGPGLPIGRAVGTMLVGFVIFNALNRIRPTQATHQVPE